MIVRHDGPHSYAPSNYSRPASKFTFVHLLLCFYIAKAQYKKLSCSPTENLAENTCQGGEMSPWRDRAKRWRGWQGLTQQVSQP